MDEQYLGPRSKGFFADHINRGGKRAGKTLAIECEIFSGNRAGGLPYSVAVAALSQRAFANLAAVSHQAIGKALRAGHLVDDEAGRLDPDETTNADWLARHRGRDGGDKTAADRGGPGPLPVGAPPPPETSCDAGPVEPALAEAGGALFADWTALQVDRDRADRLLREVPAERADQLPFLTLMLEGLRAAVAEALEVQRAELLVLWQAALEGRQDLAELLAILGATGPAGAPEPEPLAEPGESGEGP